MIRAECSDTDTTRRVPSVVIGALQGAEVFRLLAPVEVGGREVDPLTFLDVVEAASYADGSVGWCVMIGGCYATFGGMLPRDGRARDLRRPRDHLAGAFRPDGVAVEVDGGYRVTGRWPLGSGSSHANWFVARLRHRARRRTGDRADGLPLMREVFFPAVGHRGSSTPGTRPACGARPATTTP